MPKLIDSSGNMFARPDMTFEGAQVAVGGMVEVITLSEDQVLLVNEEGLLHGLPENRIASLMARRLIVGDVVYLEGDEIQQMLN
jgi:hypothetical protein